MKIEIDSTGNVILSEVYLGIGIRTDAGLFGIAQRDDGIELMREGSLRYWAGLAPYGKFIDGCATESNSDLNVWEFYRDTKQQIRWRCVDRNTGNILFVSSEGYTHRVDAEACARRAGWAG